MVDVGLRVRRFNAEAEGLLELGPLDVGRPIGHLRGRIETPLEQQARLVLESLHIFRQEMQDREGHWYQLVIRPYRTVDHRIAGVVITFQDIDALKRGLQAAEQARDYAEAMIETVREPLLVLDADLRVQRATPAFYEAFLVSREETDGRFLYNLGNGQWNRPRLRELLGNALFRNEPFQDYEVEHEFPHIGRRLMRLNARRIPHQNQKTPKVLAIEDLTERRVKAEIRFQRLFATAKDAIVVVDAETGGIIDVNPFLLELTGFTREDLVGKPLPETGPFRLMAEARTLVADTKQREVVRHDGCPLARLDDSTVPVEMVGNLYFVGSQPVVQLNIRDITARKQTETALRESEGRFRLFVDSVQDYALFQLDPDGRIVSWNSGAERLLGWREEEILGQHSAVTFTPEDRELAEHLKEIEQALTTGSAADERWHQRRDGTRFFASGVLTPVYDEQRRLHGFAKVMRDITQRWEYEQRQQCALEEKSVLVREVHHRVKNNLQMIVSLLSLQASEFNNPDLLNAFAEAEARVRAIAAIHERLYSRDNFAEVQFADYLDRLVRELLALHATGSGPVTLALHSAEMAVSMEQAIPLGLIANELVLNSLKHGFRNRAGRLTVTLEYVAGSFVPERGEVADNGWARLRVRDDGPGLPPGFDVSVAHSMGMTLINLLVRQLRGRLAVGAGPGADFAVTFPLTLE